MGYIYLVTNTITKKQYIGQTVQKDINSRWKQHKSLSPKLIGRYLLDSYKKYGISNFKFQIVCICFDEDIDYLEKYYIQKFNTLAPNGYNLTSGGKHRYLSQESKDKIRNTLSGKLGKPCSEETKKKISLANMGNKNGNFKKKMSNEQRKTVSETMKKRNIPLTSSQINGLKIGTEICKRKVGKYDKNGNLLEIYASMSDAALKVGLHYSTISKVCRCIGYQKTAGGFIWKYIE